MRRHERPLKRVNPSGAVVWVARYTDKHGQRRSAGTFTLKREAQDAIEAAYDRDSAPQRPDTVGTYAKTWTDRHPRARRTNTSYNHRVGRTLDIQVEGRPFRDWPLGEVRRRHANVVLDALLRRQGRSATGAQGILRVLSAMWQDALDDELVDANPFLRLKVKASDPRVTKAPKQIRVFSWEEMHDFAAAAGRARTAKTDEGAAYDEWRPVYAEAMVRVLADCGLRLGELLPLQRTDVRPAGPCPECERRGWPVPTAHLHVARTTHEGWIEQGTKTDHGKADAGRVVPLGPTLERMLRGLPARIDVPWLFPTPRGHLFRESGFYRDVWRPAQVESGLRANPHEFRHTWVSLLRAAGLDPSDVAAMAGHSVLTATARYTHAVGRSYDAAAAVVG